MRRPGAAISAAIALAAVAACGGGDGADDSTVTVFAAASLTDAFGEIGAAFEAADEGVAVEFNFAGSSALREQILAGAPAEVFASANPSNMDRVIEAAAGADATAFASNRLQIAVPAGNPAGVDDLDDFADSSLLLGLCAAEVPCGELAREALATAGVAAAADTDEPDVRALLTKIEAGELDAGIVYRTDVQAAGEAVEGIDIPTGQNAVATYEIASLAGDGAADADGAAAFVTFVLSEAGQAILASYGFDPA